MKNLSLFFMALLISAGLISGIAAEALSAGCPNYIIRDSGWSLGGDVSPASPALFPERAGVFVNASGKGRGISLAEIEKYPAQTLDAVNQIREQAGLVPYFADAALSEAARLRAHELMTLYSHTRPDGREFHTVYEEAGVKNVRSAGENIAKGCPLSPYDMVVEWMGSEGHRENILDPAYHYMGVGVAAGDDGSLYWAQEFKN